MAQVSDPDVFDQRPLALELLIDRAEIQWSALMDTIAQVEELAPDDDPAQLVCRRLRSLEC
jgi:hypothetical protein